MSTKTQHPKNPTDGPTGTDRRTDRRAQIRRAAADYSDSGLLVDLAALPTNTDGTERLRLVECPAPGCHEDLLGESLDGTNKTVDHLSDHDPEDFGLTPLGLGRGGEA